MSSTSTDNGNGNSNQEEKDMDVMLEKSQQGEGEGMADVSNPQRRLSAGDAWKEIADPGAGSSAAAAGDSGLQY